MDWVLLKGGRIFSPEERGVGDLLILDDRIVAVGPGLTPPMGVGDGEILDVSGRIVLPGLIDGHIHVMGASGLGPRICRSIGSPPPA
jgi:beta-aspartyl-dipeptidase (metallo-type)